MTTPNDTPTAEPQPVLAPLSSAAVFLVFTIQEGGENTVRELLPDLAGLQRSVGFRNPDALLSFVCGIGSDAWDRLFAGPRPLYLHPFQPVQGVRHHAPATPGDLLFHIRAQSFDLCFDLAALITQRLSGAADVVDEVHAFRYFDARDLLGFVDGTENPTGNAAARAVIVGADDPGFAGGSYVAVQKYVHDLDTWNGMTVEEQERIIGRTKLDNIELGSPGPSHVNLTTIVDSDGTERKILRDNMPFGTVGKDEFGTYFIGYTANPAVLELMLHRMFAGDPPGSYDRILDVSTAVTGTLFAVPSLDFLDNLPQSPTQTAAAGGTGSHQSAIR
jgi:putative iron-dependent peroxidase